MPGESINKNQYNHDHHENLRSPLFVSTESIFGKLNLTGQQYFWLIVVRGKNERGTQIFMMVMIGHDFFGELSLMHEKFQGDLNYFFGFVWLEP